MPWKIILDSLFEYLKAHNVADLLFKGLVDADGINLSSKTIACVTRGTEAYTSVYNGGEGSVILYVDMFAQYISKDMSEGYDTLDKVEKNVVECVQEWASQDQPCDLVEVMEVRITESGGNMDIPRPIVGSFITLQVDWSLRTL